MEKTLAGQTAGNSWSRMGCNRPRNTVFPMSKSAICLNVAPAEISSNEDRNWGCFRFTNWWTPAPPNSRPIRPIIIPPMSRKMKSRPSAKRRIMILGGGPNRIGQGIEFDYCCVHASLTAREEGLYQHHGQQQSGNGQHGL